MRAKNELARRNLGLVLSVVRSQSRGSVRLDDLVQEGNLGLLRAIDKFDPYAGTRFSTYAAWWIRAYVWKHLKEARSTVRPKAGTVAQQDLSLDRPIGDDDDDVSHLDRMQDEGPGPEDSSISSQRDRQVRESLAKVRGRVGDLGWDIIHTRLQKDPPDTLEQIGRRWGVSRERVRQVESQLKRFLRRYLETRVPDDLEELKEAA